MFSKRRMNFGGRYRKHNNRSLRLNNISNILRGVTVTSTDSLCNLIYICKRIYPYFTYNIPDFPHHGGFGTPNEKQLSLLNATSTMGYTPLYTACRHHSDMDLIQFLIKWTNPENINKLCGRKDGDKNTAMHAVTFSEYFDYKDTYDATTRRIKSASELIGLISTDRSIEDKIKIIEMFKKTGANLMIRNVRNDTKRIPETVYDLLYEIETLRCKEKVKKYNKAFDERFYNKYNKHDIDTGIVDVNRQLLTGWISKLDVAQNAIYYTNTQTGQSTWILPT
jgi:hypothetical protein